MLRDRSRARSIAMVIGRIAEGVPGPEVFEEIADKHGFTVFPDRKPGQPFTLLPREALGKLEGSPELGSERAVFLLCLGRDRAYVTRVILELKRRRSHAEVVVYADETHDSGVLAMDLLFPVNGTGTSGYLVRDRFSKASIMYQFLRLFGGDPIYPPFQQFELAREPSNSQAFVATPYHELALADFYYGILPAARKLGLHALLSSDELTPQSVLEKVRQHIDNSCVVFVNLSEYHGVPASPNVFFELGYSLGRGLPVVLLQRTGSGKIPSNIAGAQLVEYESCSELAMRLCFGLK